MYNKGGRHSNALEIIRKVVWASSVGGLALLAEERRRRIAFAQSIIENGRRLKAYKSYQTVSAVEVFDSGEEWNTPLPNLSPPSNVLPTWPLDTNLTNHDWRSRARTHRRIPTSTSSTQMHTQEHEVERLQSAEQTHISSTKDLNIPCTLRQHRQAYAQYLQKAVARRADQCLKSMNPFVRLQAYSEVGRYLNDYREYIWRPMRKTLHALETLEGGLATVLLAAQYSQRFQDDVLPHSNTPEVSSADVDHDRRIDHTRQETHITGANSQRVIALRIESLLECKILHDAYYEFLLLCENLIGVITDVATTAVRHLITAYRTKELFSVVEDIQERLVSIKGWVYHADDFIWLLERQTSDQYLQACMYTINSLSAFGKHEAARAVWVESIWWLANSSHVSIAISLFLHFLDSGSVCHESQRSLATIRFLYRKAIRADLISEAFIIHSWLAKRNAQRGYKPSTFRDDYDRLISSGRIREAAELYFLNIRAHLMPDKVYDAKVVDEMFLAAFQTLKYDDCRYIVQSALELECSTNKAFPSHSATSCNPALGDNSFLSDKNTVEPGWAAANASKLPAKVACILKTLQGVCMRAFNEGRLDVLEELLRVSEPEQPSHLHCFQLLIRGHSSLGDYGKVLDMSSKYERLDSLSQETLEQILRASCKEQSYLSFLVLLKDRSSLPHLSLDTLDFVCQSHGLSMEPHMIDEILHIYHQRNAFINILKLFELCQKRADILSTSLPPIYHAFAQTGSFMEVESFLRGMKSLARSSYSFLSCKLVHDSHRTLLSRCWQTTRNLALMQNVFHFVKEFVPAQAMNVMMYDAMILACVDARRPDLAKSYANQMRVDARLSPSIHTVSHFMLASAIAEDWIGVENLLKQAASTGLLPTRSRGFFDRTFSEYCRQHDAEECLHYFKHVHERYSVQVTDWIAECMTDVIFEDEKSDVMSEWLQCLQPWGVQPKISATSFILLMRRYYQGDFHKVWLSWTKAGGKGAHSEQPDNAENNLTDVLRNFVRRHADRLEQSSTSHDAVRKLVSMRGWERLQTHRLMSAALANNEPAKAVEIYQSSLKNMQPQHHQQLQLAVHASLLANQSTEQAHNLIEEAEAAGKVVDRAKTTMLIHSLKHRTVTEDEAHHLAFQHYEHLPAGRGRHNHDVTIALARNLFGQNKSWAALKLVVDVKNSIWGERVPFDMVCMTMLLRMLIKVDHVEGIKWVVETVINTDMRIDQRFVRALQLGRQISWRREERAMSGSTTTEQSRQLVAVLEECISQCQARRSQQRQGTLRFAGEQIQLLDSFYNRMKDKSKSVSEN